MNKRKGMSKKLRFEVFKRDSFSCQYCGATPSTTELEVDHIQPVAKGGGNDMLNLITSCFDCNRGKSARELSDDSVVVKQKKQLDNLQERRQQLEMMLEWRKGLDGLKSETNLMVIEYIESKIKPYTINDFGKKKLERVINKYVLEEVLEAVTVAESRYLRYGDDEVLEQSSVDNFITKITGILVNSKRSPVDQKVAYIIGICRNRFNFWNHKVGASLLKKIQLAMSNAGRTDESVLKVLTDTLQPMALESKNWTQWKEKIEEFLETLENQQAGSVTSSAPHLTLDSQKREILTEKVDSCIRAIERRSPALIAVGGSLAFEIKLTHWRLCSGVLNYLHSWCEFYLEDVEERSDFPILGAEFNGLGFMSIKEPYVTGLRSAYNMVLGNLCNSIESILLNDEEELFLVDFKFKDDVIQEDLEFMCRYFQSQIEWPSNDEIMEETNSVDCSQDSQIYSKTYTQEDLTGYVDSQLRSAKQIIPALTYMGKMFDNFQAQLLSKKINTAVLNYLLAVTELREDTGKWPDIFSEFRKLGIWEMFSHQSTDLTFCLEQAADELMRMSFENVEEYLENIDLTLENCNFMSEYFRDNALWGSDGPEKESSVILFPSQD